MINDLLQNNEEWAARRTAADADYFSRMAGHQAPDYLWIGCSDSRVPANEVVGLEPGELFVHRNVANIASPTDANFLSVLQYAVETLKVKHIIVCGHYGCGGVAAAMSGERHGLIDHWLQPIRDASDEYADLLLRIRDDELRLKTLCEIHVAIQVRAVACNPIVQDAWRAKQDLAVHGWIYGLEDGLLRDLELSLASFEDVAREFPGKLSALIGAPMKSRSAELQLVT